MKTNFTVMLNTRGRAHQLQRCIEAVEKNTKNLKEVELSITYDRDDSTTQEYLDSWSTKVVENNLYPFTLSINLERPQSLNEGLNKMAKMARGKYIFVLNDDAEIITPNWDVLALEKINNFKKFHGIKDDIIYGNINDNSADKVAGKGYASFPIISKQAVEVLGMFMYDKFVGLGGDSSIHRVYQRINRVVDMSDIMIDHVYHNAIFKVYASDQTAQEMRMNSWKNPVDAFTCDIEPEVQKLLKFINEQ